MNVFKLCMLFLCFKVILHLLGCISVYNFLFINEQTFLRQKITLESSSPTSSQTKNGSTGLDSGNDKGIPPVQKNHDNPCSGEVMHTDAVDIVIKTNSTNQRNTKVSSLENFLNKEDSSKQSPDHGSFTDECERNERKESWEKTCDELGKSLNSCSKSSNSAGPLRYALHLRFICPFPKKTNRSAQKCKLSSLPEKAGLDMEGERRFYLCNDLKVVFPQRHSDADEGKVCICLYCGFAKVLHIFLSPAKTIESIMASLCICETINLLNPFQFLFIVLFKFHTFSIMNCLFSIPVELNRKKCFSMNFLPKQVLFLLPLKFHLMQSQKLKQTFCYPRSINAWSFLSLFLSGAYCLHDTLKFHPSRNQCGA